MCIVVNTGIVNWSDWSDNWDDDNPDIDLRIYMYIYIDLNACINTCLNTYEYSYMGVYYQWYINEWVEKIRQIKFWLRQPHSVMRNVESMRR